MPGMCIALHRRSSLGIVFICMMGTLLGMHRGGVFVRTLQTYERYWGSVVTLEAVAAGDSYYEHGQVSFEVTNVVLGDERVSVPGRGTIRAQGINGVSRGDRVQAVGKLYATRGSKQFGMSYASARLLEHKPTRIDWLRQRFTASVYSVLPEPQASFGLGLLVGQRTSLPESTERDLSQAGLTHIIAVSGYNLTIIIDAVRRLLGKQSKYQTCILALLLMLGFILLTGFSASIVRASVVSTFGLWAWYYGRTFRPVLLITLVAALTALWYPIYLWSDIGWYLSFLAFFGVLVVAQLWEQRRSQLDKRSTMIGQLARESFSAQIMTIPIVMFIFGRLSIIGLLANIVVVPLVPAVMFFTACAALSSVLVPNIAGWVALPARVLLTYMLDISHILGSWRYATVARPIDAAGLVLLYGCLLVYVCILWRKVRKNATITDEKAK